MSKTFDLWYEQNYSQLSGHGIWLRGGEINTEDPAEFDRADLKIVVCRLSTSRDTANSITHKIIYQLAKGIEGTFVDFAFLPPPKDAKIFDRDGIPWILGTNTKRDALQFDLLAISNSIVQEIVNIPTMLKKSGIPLKKSIRMQSASVPLIILGGANALNTSALIGDDPLVDGVFAGEDPECIEQIFRICKGLKTGRSKNDVLEKLYTVPGFFQPDKKRLTSKCFPSTLSKKGLLHQAPVFFEEQNPGKAKLQISEGCPCFCSFCAESWGRKPYREYSAKELLEHALSMKASIGIDSVELYSFNFNMHSEFYSTLWNLHSVFSSVGLKSQRFDFIAENHELPRMLHVTGKTSITCGLEGISSRLRSYLNKNLTQAGLRSSLNLLLRAPIRELKIFLIATGLENDDDFDDFRDLLNIINEMMVSAGRKPRIIFSMTPLVRFPFTPLEFEVGADVTVYKKVIEQVERLVKSRGFEFRVACELQEYVLSQLLTRADTPRILEAIMEACEETGFVYYQEIEQNFINRLKERLLAKFACFDALLSGSNWTVESRVPVQIVPDDPFVTKVKEACTSFTDTGYCLGSYENEGACRGCGACNDAQKKKITSVREKAFFTSDQLKEKIRSNAQDSVGCIFEVTVSPQKRGISREIISMALAKAVMLSDESLIEGYRGFGCSSVLHRFSWSWIHGLDYLTLNWSRTGAATIKKLFDNPEWVALVNSKLQGWCEVHRLHDHPYTGNFKLLVRSPFPFDCDLFFKQNALKYTLRKNDEGVYCYGFTPQALKKKLFVSLEEIRNAETSTLRFIPAEKFQIYTFFKSCFRMPSENDIARIEINCLKTE